MSNVNANVGVQHLDYDQMLSQLQTLKDGDVLCIKDGKLSVWTPGTGGANAPNTKEVMGAVFESVTAKIDGAGGDYEKYRSHLIGAFDKAQKAASSKKNNFLVEDLKDFLSGFKDLNTAPKVKTETKTETKTAAKTETKAEVKAEEAKDIGSVPKPGETLTMTRAELEKNLDSWIKAGYRVTIEVENKGFYQLQGRSENDAGAHVYDALFSSADGTVVNEKCKYELLDCKYDVARKSAESQPADTTLPEVKTDDKAKLKSVPPPEIKPEIKVKITTEQKIKEEPKEETKVKQEVKTEQKVGDKRRPVEAQTPGTNTCFLWSLFNSRGLTKNKHVYAQNAEFFKQEIPGNVRVFTDNGPQDFDISELEKEVAKSDKGTAFLAKYKGLKSGFEKNLVLYCYAKNVDYRKDFDAYGSFPVGETSYVAPLLGLEQKDHHQVKFNVKGKNLTPAEMGGNAKPDDVLPKIRDCLARDELVTLNLDGAHFVSVESVDVNNKTITYFDSAGGAKKTGTLADLARSYQTHGKDRILTFSTFGLKRGDAIADNLNGVLDFVEELASYKGGQPKSTLMKELLDKCGGDLKNCKGLFSYSQINAFSAYVPTIRKLKSIVLSTFRKDDYLRVTAESRLTGNKDDTVVNFLSNIVAYLGAFKSVDERFALPPLPSQWKQAGT